MKFSYNWLQSFFQKKLPQPQKLADLLTEHFAEVEEVKKYGRDFILDIDVRPNRASDCFSHIGVAREIAAILSCKLQAISYKLIEDKKLRTNDFVKVVVENKGGCPRYTARVIDGVKVGSSPQWLKEKLEICGLRPINNIVDITNYVMLETGQPLHAFDQEKIKGHKIIVRFAETGERITTLDGDSYKLDENVLVIADAEKPIAIAGLKGGKTPEIDEKTKTVVLESANFNPHNIRKSSRAINLKTDASLRFEHGLSPELAEGAINRAAYLIQKLAGGKIAKGLIDVYPKKTQPSKILFDLNYAEKLLGVKIAKTEAMKILRNLGFAVKETKKDLLAVLVPTRRLDVNIPEDLVEEIGRIKGYEKIPAIAPIAPVIPPEKNLEIFWEDVSKNILKEAGFTEVYNYSFISGHDKEIFNYQNKDLIELENPLSSDFKYLRPSLIPNLLENTRFNQKNFSGIQIFELGKIFSKNFSEKRMLTCAITGSKFYEAKGITDLLLQKLGISDVWYDEYQPSPEDSKATIWKESRCAEIKVNGSEIGFLGEISQKTTSALKIESKIVMIDIDFTKLSQLASEEKEYKQISRYPSAVRDIAVLVPRLVRVEEALNKIYDAGGILVRDVDLFDIYESEGLPAGKKNLAFHIIYQAEDRTLSSKEIDAIQNKIINILEEDPEWEVRR